MFSTSIIPFALSALTPFSMPSSAPALRSDGIELVARTTSTRFAALNPSDHALWLVFVDAESGAHASLVLPAGAEVEYRLPEGVLAHLELEVLAPDHGHWTASGALDLAELAAPEVDALWIKRCTDAEVPFAQVGDRFRAIAVDHHVTRDEVTRGASDSSCTTHVPVISPMHHRLPDTPPKLEKYVPPI